MSNHAGPEKLSKRILEYYRKLSLDPENNYYVCLISPQCTKPLNGKKLSNLVSHAKTHKEFYRENFCINDARLKMPTKRLKFIQGCTEFVTVNGQPLSSLNKSGFKRLNAETLQVLKDSGFGDGLGENNQAVYEHIKYLSLEIINEIKQEVKSRLVSVMVDTATLRRRSIMGISLQFSLNSAIAIRSISMIHLTSSHTAQHMADKLMERLQFFGISLSQVISITADNASNVQAMINCMNAMPDGDDDSDTAFDSTDEVGEAQAIISLLPHKLIMLSCRKHYKINSDRFRMRLYLI